MVDAVAGLDLWRLAVAADAAQEVKDLVLSNDDWCAIEPKLSQFDSGDEFLKTWNDFMGPLIYLTGIENYTIAIGLRWFNQSINTHQPRMMAMAVVALIPQILIFFFTQKQMVQGVTLTGIKG